MHKPTRKNAGFTLVELMVSISILALMLFLINEIFNSTSVAVTTSVQNSKNIATARVVGEQVAQDASAMVGPDLGGEGGYIVLIQRRINDVALRNPRNLAEVNIPQLRSDQIVFIRDAAGLRSITPQDIASYRSNLIGQSGDYAKVWYGHAIRSQTDGEPTGAGAAYQLGGADAGFDRVASDWILGRQAMLFNPTDEAELAKAPASQRPDPTVAGLPGDYAHADNAYFGSQVQNIGTYNGPKQSFMGLTDVTRQRYLPTTDPDALSHQLIDRTTLTYDDRTLNYVQTAYRVDDGRLRVNTAPSPADTGYASWAIAQGHAILAPNTSEVVIDFAADLNGNGRIDMKTIGGGPDTDGAIVWYDALKQSFFNFTWQRSAVPEMQPFINTYSNADTKVFVFRIEDAKEFDSTDVASGTSNWPYLIRIRYRLHDTRGRLTSNDPAAINDGIDNDGDGDVDELGEDQIAGRWYEHIIKVPRPDPQ